jgi:hypothetical protein
MDDLLGFDEVADVAFFVYASSVVSSASPLTGASANEDKSRRRIQLKHI